MDYVVINMGVIIYAGLFIVSLFGSLYFFRKFLLAKRSVTWPKTSGKIIYFKTSSVSGTKNDHTSWFYRIKYMYVVNDVEYTGSRVNFGDTYSISNSLSGVVELEKRYPTNSQVSIFYHPAKPNLGVLEPGLTSGLKYILIFWLASLVLWLFGIINS